MTGTFALHELTYTDEMLAADVEEGSYGVTLHSRQAEQLLRLDTIDRRKRAMAEAQTLVNLMGGVLSGRLYEAVSTLLRNIEAGDEEAELYGERTARTYREREAELRKVTGNANAIYYPKGL